jgi:hypothetical protein
MTYLTLQIRPIKYNITINKWRKSGSNPIDIVTQTNIMMYVITIIIRTLEMTCTSGASERLSIIILDISFLGDALRILVTHLIDY